MEAVQDNILDFVGEGSQPVPQISLGEEFALPQPSQDIIDDSNIKNEVSQHTSECLGENADPQDILKIQKRRVRCPECDKYTCETEEKLLMHIRKHTSECLGENADPQDILKIQKRRVRCPECDKYTCETEEKLLMHIRKVHRKENPFQCYMCDYSTYNKTLFEEHCRIHQGIKPFKCSKCPYRSASKKNTKKHELLHRPDNPRKCNLCEFIGRNKYSLLKHKLDEHGVDLKCGHCDHIALTEEELRMHSLKHINGQLSCKRCGLKYDNKVQLRKHNSGRKKCHCCRETLCSRKLLKAHLVAEHGMVVEAETVKESLFKCAICEWSSSIITKILLHLIHHPHQVVDETVVDVSVLRKHGIMM